MTVRTLTTKKGKTVETVRTDREALDVLKVNEGSLGGFGKDLLRKEGRWGLSHDQWVWVHVLANEITGANMAGEVEEVTAEDAEELNLAPIPEMLRRARENGLKYPKIRLKTEDGADVVLSLAGPKARYPGSVNVTDGRRYPQNAWYGRIHEDGRLEGGKAMVAAVRALLETFAGDPAGTGRMQGALTGSCCFCGKELTTRESVGAGYGPVCADKYGLPWGAETAAEYDSRKAAAVADSVGLADEGTVAGVRVPRRQGEMRTRGESLADVAERFQAELDALEAARGTVATGSAASSF